MFNTYIKQSIPLNLSRRVSTAHACPKDVEHGRKIKVFMLIELKQLVAARLIPFGIVNW